MIASDHAIASAIIEFSNFVKEIEKLKLQMIGKDHITNSRKWELGKEMVLQCQLQLVALLFAEVLKAKRAFGSST